MDVKDYGSISLLKAEDKSKSCCGLENCECKINKDFEPIWKCKVCNHSNFKSQSLCFYCKNSNTPDFSASQGPDSNKLQMEIPKMQPMRKESDKLGANRQRAVQRPKGYKKQNVTNMQKSPKLNNSF